MVRASKPDNGHLFGLARPLIRCEFCVCQVGYLGADYDQWVHDPIISRESPRFFESDFHEVCCASACVTGDCISN